jgi:hypothetical protein
MPGAASTPCPAVAGTAWRAAWEPRAAADGQRSRRRRAARTQRHGRRARGPRVAPLRRGPRFTRRTSRRARRRSVDCPARAGRGRRHGVAPQDERSTGRSRRSPAGSTGAPTSRRHLGILHRQSPGDSSTAWTRPPRHGRPPRIVTPTAGADPPHPDRGDERTAEDIEPARALSNAAAETTTWACADWLLGRPPAGRARRAESGRSDRCRPALPGMPRGARLPRRRGQGECRARRGAET